MKGLETRTLDKLTQCSKEVAEIMDKYFPEVRTSWNAEGDNNFDDRVKMTIYLELIHAGIFK